MVVSEYLAACVKHDEHRHQFWLDNTCPTDMLCSASLRFHAALAPNFHEIIWRILAAVWQVHTKQISTALIWLQIERFLGLGCMAITEFPDFCCQGRTLRSFCPADATSRPPLML